MKIRFAQQGDAEGIAKVHVQSWQETYRGIMPDDLLDNLSLERRVKWWTQIIDEQLDDSPLYVALNDDNEIVGFASGGKVRGDFEDYDSELYAIYSLKAVHGQGIGRALVEHLAQALHDMAYKAMMLWVAKRNKTEQFYAHMGGKPFSEKVDRFYDTEIIEIGYGWTDIKILLPDETSRGD